MKLAYLIGAALITFGLQAGAQAGSVPSHAAAMAEQSNDLAVLARGRGGRGGT